MGTTGSDRCTPCVHTCCRESGRPPLESCRKQACYLTLVRFLHYAGGAAKLRESVKLCQQSGLQTLAGRHAGPDLARRTGSQAKLRVMYKPAASWCPLRSAQEASFRSGGLAAVRGRTIQAQLKLQSSL